MLRVEGECWNPRVFRFEDLRALPGQVEDLATLMAGKRGSAVRLDALLDVVRPDANAAFASLASADGKFVISVPLAAITDNAVIAYREGEVSLSAKQGGPARFLILDVGACGSGSGVDACANVKGLGSIRLTAAREADVGHSHG